MKNRSINVERAERLREARLRQDDEDAHDEVAAAEQAARDAGHETSSTTPSARASREAIETAAARATDAQVHEAEMRVDRLRVLSRFCAFSSVAILSLAVVMITGWLTRMAPRLDAPYLEVDLFHTIHSRVLIPFVGYSTSSSAVNFGIMLFLLLPVALAGTWRMHRSLAPSLEILERAGTPGASEAIGRLVDTCLRSRFVNPIYVAKITATYRRMNGITEAPLRNGSPGARHLAADLGALVTAAVLTAGFVYGSVGPPGRPPAFLRASESPMMLLLATYFVGLGFVAYRLFKRIEARITR